MVQEGDFKALHSCSVVSGMLQHHSCKVRDAGQDSQQTQTSSSHSRQRCDKAQDGQSQGPSASIDLQLCMHVMLSLQTITTVR